MSKRIEYTARAEDEGMSLGKVLQERLSLTVRQIRKIKFTPEGLKLNGAREAGGRLVTTRTVIHENDVITAFFQDEGPSVEIGEINGVSGLKPKILYEDEDLLVLNKSAGIAVHSAALTEETVTVAGAVAHYLGGAPFHPVNRLDRGVTGIMVVAKSGYIHHRCMAILHTDEFRREYRGICRGVPDPPSGTIRFSIGRDPDSVLKRRIDPSGLSACSQYEVLQTQGDRTLLRLRPFTGRTHQLRLHCAAIGHPLLGDWLYGTEDRSLIARPALHSYELWLRHPLSGEILHVIAPLPGDMMRLIP